MGSRRPRLLEFMLVAEERREHLIHLRFELHFLVDQRVLNPTTLEF